MLYNLQEIIKVGIGLIWNDVTNKNGVASWGILIFLSAGAYEENFLIDCNSAEE